ncbi:MAG: sigma-70 family RNA polymerase sigma factor [Chitinivibrionales bacterium]|nr:sigma-70 family RNA polymerase sigma factor [Chitinivibrionales bacterium]MBD3395340.1 sigma-70 family RNA polymerase sigma factor [Chitinivibrionales bacterium]
MARRSRKEKGQSLSEDGTLGLYLKEIAHHKALSSEQEAEVARRIKKGDKKAVERLVKANLRFVVSVARNYQNQGMPLADLINEGNLGLIRAAYRFDEKKNFKFISYAVWWIRQAILQSLANHSRIVKMPLNRVATIHKVGKARAKLEQRYRRLPNSQELADELGIEESEVSDMMQIGNSHTSLDAPFSDGKKGSLLDLMTDDGEEDDPDQRMVKLSLSEEISKLLSTLNAREREVLSLYFGIGHDTAYTLEEIGIRTRITRERVRQIKDSALEKLRSSGRSRPLKNYAI